MSLEALKQDILAGQRRALARGLSLMELGGREAEQLSDLIWPHTGKALRLGLTGPPGVGKSSLCDQLALALAADEKNLSVGVLAVDPSSPFSHGALLGDRIRMEQAVASDAIFVRSMANRGELGGMARAASAAADLFDAAACKYVIFETVGVGQSEIEVCYEADITAVVLAPGAGDGIQAMKSGLMEIADIFIINKCDLAGADALEAEIIGAIELSARLHGKDIPIIQVSALKRQGLAELQAVVEKQTQNLEGTEQGRERRRNSVKRRLQRALTERCQQQLDSWLNAKPERLDDILARKLGLNQALSAFVENSLE